MPHPQFTKTEISLSASATLEDASVYKSTISDTDIEFCFKYQRKFKDKDETHWVNTDINISRDQAAILHHVLGLMLDAPEPARGTSHWVICSGEFDEQYKNAS
jgi:hypothetical protein